MGDKKLVLIVEDNEKLNNVFSRVLNMDTEYEAQSVFTLAEARQWLEIAAPDVMLLDVNLPDGSGIDLCREIRDVIPSHIIFMTTTPDFSVELECLKAGGDDFLLKPFDIELLRAKVENGLRSNTNEGKG